jgi:hypothetical protein
MSDIATATREPLYMHGVDIDYTNYRGERAVRRIVPREMFFGSTDYHAEPQWLLAAIDVSKKAERVFAMRDVHSWTPVNQ